MVFGYDTKKHKQQEKKIDNLGLNKIKNLWIWECTSGVECVLSMCDILGPIPSTKNQNKNKCKQTKNLNLRLLSRKQKTIHKW
jgi:hypothetical protein